MFGAKEDLLQGPATPEGLGQSRTLEEYELKQVEGIHRARRQVVKRRRERCAWRRKGFMQRHDASRVWIPRNFFLRGNGEQTIGAGREGRDHGLSSSFSQARKVDYYTISLKHACFKWKIVIITSPKPLQKFFIPSSPSFFLIVFFTLFSFVICLFLFIQSSS